MFEKLVAIEPIGVDEEHVEKLKTLCREYVAYEDIPQSLEEVIRRIGDADGVLVSFTTLIPRAVIEACPNVRYIGMCCSLYDEQSANVDIPCCREKGIVVTGIRDYGDPGVTEFGISRLVDLLHGFGEHQWKERPTELTGVKCGIVGLGTTGILMADALQFFGAEVYYYSRTRKPEQEEKGFVYLPLPELLEKCEIISTHLNKNTILLHEKEFDQMGNGKILLNTAIGPSFDVPALKKWLEASQQNYYICDETGMTGCHEELANLPHVLYTPRYSGSGIQCTQRLSQKVTENVEKFLEEHK